jgi:RNA polymerase sigma factor (sigma-70 family)
VEDEERALVERCLAGDQDACRLLADAHARMVGTVIESFDASPADEREAMEALREPAVSAEARVIRDEEVRRMHEALARLPDKYRLPLTYATIEGLDYPTIAAMLGATVGGVKTLVFRAKRMLRDALTNAV